MEGTSSSDQDLWMTKIMNAVRSFRSETLRSDTLRMGQLARASRTDSHDASSRTSNGEHG